MDEDLRALERAAQDPTTRLRYAEALLRLGRVAEAVAALVPAIDDASIRARVGRMELPFTPITQKPRVVWRNTVEGSAPFMELHASPLGLLATARATVATERDWSTSRVYVFDAESGARRDLTLEGRPFGIFGHVILTNSSVGGRHELAGVDIVSGERLWTLQAEHVGLGLRGIRATNGGQLMELTWPSAERQPHRQTTGEPAVFPLRASVSGVMFDTPTLLYGIFDHENLEGTREGAIYARAKTTKARLWTIPLPGVRAIAAVRQRLYAIAGASVFCLE